MENNKVYFADTKGNLLKYTIVSEEERLKRMISPQTGCDLIVRDENGCTYSGSSKSYLPSKTEVLAKAQKEHSERFELHKQIMEEEGKILKKIGTQLDLLQQLTKEV